MMPNILCFVRKSASRNSWSLLFTSLMAVLTFWTSVGLCEDYQEVTYDDLINQLSKKKTQAQNVNHHPFDKIMFHAGFGLISSANTVRINERDLTKYQNGFQLSLGVDLFSDSWATEGVIRNFGTATSGTESRSLREFDLKVLNRYRFNSSSAFRLGAGLGTRYLKISDARTNLALDETTPVSFLFSGFDGFISSNLSLGIEAGLRSAMITRTADKNSLDITVRLDTYF